MALSKSAKENFLHFSLTKRHLAGKRGNKSAPPKMHFFPKKAEKLVASVIIHELRSRQEHLDQNKFFFVYRLNFSRRHSNKNCVDIGGVTKVDIVSGRDFGSVVISRHSSENLRLGAIF